MPDNAIYSHIAYISTIVLFVGYWLTIVIRRRGVAERSARQRGSQQ